MMNLNLHSQTNQDSINETKQCDGHLIVFKSPRRHSSGMSMSVFENGISILNVCSIISWAGILGEEKAKPG